MLSLADVLEKQTNPQTEDFKNFYEKWISLVKLWKLTQASILKLKNMYFLVYNEIFVETTEINSANILAKPCY